MCVFIAFDLDTYGSKSDLGKEKLPAAVELGISTEKMVPLYKDIHSACTADIFFSPRMMSRDILSEPYFSIVKDLNFNSLHYSGGSTSDHEHVIVGDTKIYGGTGEGYNIRESDVKQRGEDARRILGGIMAARFGKDFFNEFCAFVDKLGIHSDIIANVQVGTLEELFWKIERSKAKRVIFGMEQNLTGNSHVFSTGKAYKEKISKWIKQVKDRYPDIITVIDAAPIWRGTTRFIQWNDDIKDMPGDEARLYFWDKDFLRYKPDVHANLAIINHAFEKVLPEGIADFQARFPGKKLSMWQWGLKRRSGKGVYDSMLGCLYIGKFYKWMIDYNVASDNFISYASYMSLKGLCRAEDEVNNHYHAMKLCGMLFAGNKRVCSVTSSETQGLQAVACRENGRYCLLLINETADEIKNVSIKVDGVNVDHGIFTKEAIYAESLDSYRLFFDNDETSSLIIKPYSLNIIKFSGPSDKKPHKAG